MKNRISLSITYVVLGVLLTLIPTVIFPVCVSEKKMSCFYTGRAEVGLGLLIIILGIAYILFKSSELRAGISISVLGISALVALFPLKITGLCKMSDMACRIGTLPGLVVISIIIAAVSLVNFIFLIFLKKDKSNETA